MLVKGPHGNNKNPWWRYQMETFSALLVTWAWNSSVIGEFPAQRPVTRSFDVFFDLRLNKRLSKQTPSFPLWRQCNANYLKWKWGYNQQSYIDILIIETNFPDFVLLKNFWVARNNPIASITCRNIGRELNWNYLAPIYTSRRMDFLAAASGSLTASVCMSVAPRVLPQM